MFLLIGPQLADEWQVFGGKLLMQQMPYPVIRSLSLLPMEVPRDLEDMKGMVPGTIWACLLVLPMTNG